MEPFSVMEMFVFPTSNTLPISHPSNPYTHKRRYEPLDNVPRCSYFILTFVLTCFNADLRATPTRLPPGQTSVYP